MKLFSFNHFAKGECQPKHGLKLTRQIKSDQLTYLKHKQQMHRSRHNSKHTALLKKKQWPILGI